MTQKESDLHLFQPPMYQSSNGTWFSTFEEALVQSDNYITWDLTTILSILSFNYACGDRTLVNEIKRKPWLSSIRTDGTPRFNSIPPHGRVWKPYVQIAKSLETHLLAEALEACQGHDEIYVLLSGGLDSRITAGVVSKLYHNGKLKTKPIAVTWGLHKSRDVVYGQKIAKILDLDWIYVNLNHEFVLRNVEAASTYLAGLVSPVHLHAMLWFENVSEDAIVLASSYGDMVGRAEFAKKHLLELDHLKPVNKFGLLSPWAAAHANEQISEDLRKLHARSTGQPKYVLCEHEMHCNYTRGMLAQAMVFINKFCTVYQMFTHPQVYSYMWSIHPSLRFDDVYAELLELLDPRLLSLPWARTNQALRGKTADVESQLNPDFHAYSSWISGPAYEEFKNLVDIKWFESNRMFNSDKIKLLCDRVENKTSNFRYYDTFVWLASLRRFAEWCNNKGIQIRFPELDTDIYESVSKDIREREISWLRKLFSRSIFLQRVVKSVRRLFLRLKVLLLYPPAR